MLGEFDERPSRLLFAKKPGRRTGRYAGLGAYKDWAHAENQKQERLHQFLKRSRARIADVISVNGRNADRRNLRFDLDGTERVRLLSAFLTERRCRIDPTTPVVGDHPRRVEAIGNLVTPREIADAAGINRRWYELAERGEPTRASAAVLRALGDVLGLSPLERGILVRLATPYFARHGPRDKSLEMRDAFSSLRDYLRKLYACSTMDEVLSLVQDTAASHFPEASYLTTPLRLPDGSWSFRGEATGRASHLPAFTYNREVVGRIFATERLGADDLMCFPEGALPGDLITYSYYDEARIAGIVGEAAFRGFKQLHETMLAAVIRTRDGLVAHVYLGDFRKFYDNDLDRELVGTIVDFASLAASS